MWPPLLQFAVGFGVLLDHRHHPTVHDEIIEANGGHDIYAAQDTAESARIKMEKSQDIVRNRMEEGLHYKEVSNRLRKFVATQDIEKKKLEKEKERLKATNAEMLANVKKHMAPKIAWADQNEKKATMEMAKVEEEMHAWEEKVASRLKEGKKGLQLKRDKLQDFRDAETKLEEAREEFDRSEQDYVSKQENVDELISSYQAAVETLSGERKRVGEAKKQLELNKKAKDSLNEIRDQQIARAGKALEIATGKINIRESTIDAKVKKASGMVDEMDARYEKWQKRQQKQTDKLSKSTKEYQDKARRFHSTRAKVLEDASKKAAKREQEEDPFTQDDWAWVRDEAEVNITPSENKADTLVAQNAALAKGSDAASNSESKEGFTNKDDEESADKDDKESADKDHEESGDKDHEKSPDKDDEDSADKDDDDESADGNDQKSSSKNDEEFKETHDEKSTSTDDEAWSGTEASSSQEESSKTFLQGYVKKKS